VRGSINVFDSLRVPLTRIASSMRSGLSPQAGRGKSNARAACIVTRQYPPSRNPPIRASQAADYASGFNPPYEVWGRLDT
jgi:hypothetical protein